VEYINIEYYGFSVIYVRRNFMKEITLLINLEDAIRNYLMFKKPLDNQLPELIRLKKWQQFSH